MCDDEIVHVFVTHLDKSNMNSLMETKTRHPAGHLANSVCPHKI